MHILKSLRKKCLPIIIEKLWYVIGFKVRLSNSNLVRRRNLKISVTSMYRLQKMPFMPQTLNKNVYGTLRAIFGLIVQFLLPENRIITIAPLFFSTYHSLSPSHPSFPPPPHTYTHTTRKHTKSYVLKKHYKGNYV